MARPRASNTIDPARAKIASKINYREAIAAATGNLAEVALLRNDWPGAERLARAALMLSEDLGRLELVGADCQRLASALAQQGNHAEGLPLAQRAVEIFSRLRKPDDLAQSQATLRDCIGAASKPPSDA